MRRRNLIINTFLLTFSTMSLGILGMVFRIYLSNQIGSEGMGLYQLIMSINVFAWTIAISGIRLTLTRLIAEEIGKKSSKDKIRHLLKCGFIYTLFFSCISALGLYYGSHFISTVLIGDIRAQHLYKFYLLVCLLSEYRLVLMDTFMDAEKLLRVFLQIL